MSSSERSEVSQAMLRVDLIELASCRSETARTTPLFLDGRLSSRRDLRWSLTMPGGHKE